MLVAAADGVGVGVGVTVADGDGVGVNGTRTSSRHSISCDAPKIVIPILVSNVTLYGLVN